MGYTMRQPLQVILRPREALPYVYLAKILILAQKCNNLHLKGAICYKGCHVITKKSHFVTFFLKKSPQFRLHNVLQLELLHGHLTTWYHHLHLLQSLFHSFLGEFEPSIAMGSSQREMCAVIPRECFLTKVIDKLVYWCVHV